MTLQEWLNAYGVSHKNKTNILIHKFCVPAILWSVIVLLSVIPTPLFFKGFNFAHLVAIIALVFYFSLGLKPFLLMCVQLSIAFFSLQFIDESWQLGLGVFVIAWIFQFIGHKIEGAKPSFIDDLKFLLIGPLWIIKGLLS